MYEWIETYVQAHSLNPYGLLVLLGVSFLLGITHTFGPGHGKTMLLGVLVADSRRIGHALKMAFVIGITHMADVIVLSFVSIFVVASLPMESVSSVIRWGSGTGIILIGLWRTIQSLRFNDDEGVSYENSHAQSDHNHARTRESQNLLTAFLYSLAPCPGAWILFMACLGLGKPIFGFVLLLGFTVGLLLAIGSIAVGIVYSLQRLESFLPDWIMSSVHLISGLLITTLGVWLILGGLGHAH